MSTSVHWMYTHEVIFVAPCFRSDSVHMYLQPVIHMYMIHMHHDTYIHVHYTFLYIIHVYRYTCTYLGTYRELGGTGRCGLLQQQLGQILIWLDDATCHGATQKMCRVNTPLVLIRNGLSQTPLVTLHWSNFVTIVCKLANSLHPRRTGCVQEVSKNFVRLLTSIQAPKAASVHNGVGPFTCCPFERSV
jgi:hypothetical protein